MKVQLKGGTYGGEGSDAYPTLQRTWHRSVSKLICIGLIAQTVKIVVEFIITRVSFPVVAVAFAVVLEALDVLGVLSLTPVLSCPTTLILNANGASLDVIPIPIDTIHLIFAVLTNV